MGRRRPADFAGTDGKVMGMRLFEWLFRWIAGGVFVYAASLKIMVPCELAMDIYQYQLAPGVLINIGAIILPYVEMILGICLIIGLAPRGAALGISVILVIFIIVLGINLVRGIDFECGCFGDTQTDLCNTFAEWVQKDRPNMDPITFVRIRTACDIFRDILLLGCSVMAFILLDRRKKESSRRIRPV